ncbi:hypothetical protein AB0H71_13590 [Nocardia sp. NPDC050697]|uniref:hypothetical protein n=1 Tax=Nocardia sp. NPDC050697 TaxID=3155158 RepID=UPI0033C6B8C1
MSEEIGSSGYTRSGEGGGWPTISIPFEWSYSDETGDWSGPISDGVIVGGRHDGERIAPPRPPAPFVIDPGSVRVELHRRSID